VQLFSLEHLETLLGCLDLLCQPTIATTIVTTIIAIAVIAAIIAAS